MRLMGSFHTTTIHGRSVVTSSSTVGSSTSTGDGEIDIDYAVTSTAFAGWSPTTARTPRLRLIVAIHTAVAPAMWTPTSTAGSRVKYCTYPTVACATSTTSRISPRTRI